MVTRVASDRQGIQSIEVGFRLLSVLSGANRPMMLRDIAKGAGMPAAKAHRYMISFMRIGIRRTAAPWGRGNKSGHRAWRPLTCAAPGRRLRGSRVPAAMVGGPIIADVTPRRHAQRVAGEVSHAR